MIYLVIMFLVAGAGLFSLWLQQRRTRAHLDTVDGFRSSLEALSAAPVVRPRRRAPQPSRRGSAPRRAAAATPGRRDAPHRSAPSRLDPDRRAAARKRIEARRRAAARSRAL
ncbi:MAG TPA: hypothetical protein VHN37_13830 [Actinomycetota bacterium]|nr:hypothetical protein [Actinomycetota bacterium]